MSPRNLEISLTSLAFLHSLPWREGTYGLTPLLKHLEISLPSALLTCLSEELVWSRVEFSHAAAI